MTYRSTSRIGSTLTGLVSAFLAFDVVLKVLQLAPVVETTTRLGYPVETILWIGVIELVFLVLYATSTLILAL